MYSMPFQYITRMMTTTTVESEAGRPVVVKRASGKAATRLRREAERLQRARHPGVVVVVRSGATDAGWELATDHAGRAVAGLGRLRVPQVAGLVAGVAATLADLHGLDIVHGRVDATHILVGAHGRPVLCGFGDGEPPARPDDDVAALGALLVDLLAGDDSGEPIPERRWRGRATGPDWDRRALLLLADQAAAEPPTRRPTARRLAAALAETVPGPARIEALPTADVDAVNAVAPTDPIERLRVSAVVDGRRRPWPRRAPVLALLGAGLAAAGLLHQLDAGDAPGRSGAAPSAGSGTAPPTGRVASPIQGSELTSGGHTYRVGQAGDEVLVDDWDCDGQRTPALLRPATGEVFVFPRWAEERPLSVAPVAQVVGADALVTTGRGGACPGLSVRTADGELVSVLEGPR
jgi:hypothetical protein